MYLGIEGVGGSLPGEGKGTVPGEGDHSTTGGGTLPAHLTVTKRPLNVTGPAAVSWVWPDHTSVKPILKTAVYQRTSSRFQHWYLNFFGIYFYSRLWLYTGKGVRLNVYCFNSFASNCMHLL